MRAPLAAIAGARAARRARQAAVIGLLPYDEVVTAQTIARAMKISQRTVYRYIVDLRSAGERIDAAAGTGYMRRPPLSAVVSAKAAANVIRQSRIDGLLALLPPRKVVTARALAEALRVSERTVYRDIDSLRSAGFPIIAGPGLGYMRRAAR